jgi:DNA-binding transcriptional LysR family regulator
MVMAQEFNWKNVDLNLLVAFYTLYQCQSVSLAAEKCFVSQSAMSHTLQRMRTLFDDSLFERVGNKMEPTHHANQIAPTIERLLRTVQTELLVKAHFSPELYRDSWKIGLTDYAEQLFASQLFDAIKQKSPHSQISFVNVNRSNYVEVSENSLLDVIVGNIVDIDPHFHTELLYMEQHLCLFDSRVVELRDSISLEEFISLEHALVSPNEKLASQLDGQLAKLGYQRRVAVSSRHFLTIKNLLEGRKLLSIVPARFAKRVQEASLLSVVQCPIEISDFPISLIYRKKHQNEEKSQWLRKVVKSIVY